jgi:hypothetical protein
MTASTPEPAVQAADSQRPSRRALIVGALGGLGAWAAAAVGRVSPVHAEGENVVVGGEYTTAQTVTRLRNQTNGNPVFVAESASSGIAVYGTSMSGVGVYGDSNSNYGVTGVSDIQSAIVGVSSATNQPSILGRSQAHSTGVQGHSGNFDPPLAPAKTGVFGYANQDSGSRGVWGRSGSGVGLYGQANSGVALQTAGRVKFSTSGVATIGAGNDRVTVTPGVNVTAGSFVLLTPKVNLGGRDLWFTTNATQNRFTIRMSSPRSSGTKVAWLLLG